MQAADPAAALAWILFNEHPLRRLYTTSSEKRKPCVRHRLVFFVAVFAACAVVQPLKASNLEDRQCVRIQIAPGALTTAERNLICRAERDVSAFFNAHGIEQKHTIRVQIVAEGLDQRFPHIGSYSAEQQLIKMLSQDKALCRQNENRLFGLPMDETLYRSVVVHELAHAIADQNFGYEHPSLVVQEYIAYVAQLATMPPDVKEKILSGSAVTGYETIDEMSCIYYAMDPSGFGIKAYRHFVALPDPGEFLRHLLSGAIRPGDIGTE